MQPTELNRDIRRYEPKFLLNMTKRQFLIVLVGAIIVLTLILFIPVSVDVKIFLFIFLMIPVLIFAFFNVNGMPFEIFLAHVIYCKFLTPGHRRYIAVNTTRKAADQISIEEEKERYAKMSAKEKKQYLKQQKKQQKKHKNEPTIRYSKGAEYKIYL